MAKRQTIVFLHGTRLTAAQWTPQVAALRDEFDCLALDLPGHGTSADQPFSLATAAESVAESIAQGAGGRAILVGLSLGGYVAMDVAARWPERVSGLVLAGATNEPRGLRALPYHALGWALSAPPEAWLDEINAWFFRHRYPPSIADPIIAGGFAFRTGAQAVRAIIGEKFRPRLARYPGRTLILNGEFDLLFRLSERSFAAVAADPRRIMLRRATHLSNLDQPEAFTAAVRRFARAL
jgi:pimeloyl-ACP methyl ester carboxylesterase